MAAENIPPEAVGTGIGAIIVGALLVIKKFILNSDPPVSPDKREDMRRENDKFNEVIVKNISSSVDNLAHIMQIHSTHQQEFRMDFKNQMSEFKEDVKGQINEFKTEIREDIRDLKQVR